MPRSKKRKPTPKKPGEAAAAPATQPAAKPRTRRETLLLLRDYGVIAAGVLAVGWWVGSDLMAKSREQDLTRIGAGVPTIVQIHDPQCSQCAALQSAARDAMGAFSDDELRFVVANIATPDGRALANAHGVGHVTLLFFDGDGRRRRVMTGVQTSGYLETVFRSHIQGDS